MRKLVPIAVSFFGLLACFLVYLHFQPTLAPLATSAPQGAGAGIATTKSDDVFVGPGKGAWVVQPDKFGRIAYRFRTDFYDPQPDGTVLVTQPVIEIFQEDGQVIHIEGVDGVVRMPPGEGKVSMSSSPSAPPQSGRLRNVLVKMYSSIDQQLAHPNTPDMTLTMSNAQFDNDTFRLFTDEYTDAAGKVVPAEYVPVQLRAQDYTFDGSGLVMFWNGMDQQLKSLEIAHGTKLTIYNSSQFSPANANPQTASPAAKAPAPLLDPSQKLVPVPRSTPPALENANNGPPAAPAASPPPVPKRYLATFNEDVRVIQGDQEIKDATRLEVDFVPKNSPAAAPDADTAPTASNAPAAPPTPAIPPAASGQTPAAQNSLATPGDLATTKPAPIEVFWKGTMRMVPVVDPKAEPIAPGQTIVRFAGSPVRIHQAATTQPGSGDFDAQCANITYHTADSIVRLISSPKIPVTLTQKHPDSSVSAVSTLGSMQFSRLDHVAVLEGQSDAQFPDPNDPKSVLSADWSRNCIVHLLPGMGGQMQVQSADLSGNVTVDHPRFHLTSTDLALAFEQPPASAGTSEQDPSSSPQLKQIVATGDATCVVHETDHRARSIAGQTLQLKTARGEGGKLFAKTIIADGAAKAIQDDQDLSAEHIQIGLRPTDPARRAAHPTDPAAGSAAGVSSGDVELDTLAAADTVRVQTKDSSIAADDMRVDRVNGFSKVTLHGKPAVVVSATSIIRGPEIHISSADQTSSVVGPGTLSAQQQAADASRPPRPMLLRWTDRALLDGKANTIQVLGSVDVQSKAAGGELDLAQAGHLTLYLAEKAATQPSPHAATTNPATAPDSGAIAGEFDFMHNKQVKLIALRDRAKVESSLTDAAGTLLRRSDLFGNHINYDTLTQRLIIPGIGNMLIYDHAAAGAPLQPTPADSSPTGGHGRTAFEWQKQFVYDQVNRIAFIQGNVVMLHIDENPDSKSIEIRSDTMTAAFEPADAAPAKKPAANQPADDTPHLQLRHMTAAGAVVVLTGDTTITCGQIEYDPTANRLICRSGDLGAVNFTNVEHRDKATADEVWLNTKTNTIEKITNLNARGRR
ncbi:MAG: hypothetical protein M3O30_10790 [Planctomycetota bacterium]|nr:hypothetical protein [Planctomycetota bacterium]